MYQIQEPDELRMLVVSAVAEQQISPEHLTDDEVVWLRNYAMEMMIEAMAEEGEMVFAEEECPSIH